MEQSVTIKAVIDITGMRPYLLVTMRMSASFLRMRISLRYAEPVRLDGCLGTDSVSKFSIFSFNSISVIGFSIWHSSCDGRNTIPATALLHMLLLLRFLALLLEWYHLFHW